MTIHYHSHFTDNHDMEYSAKLIAGLIGGTVDGNPDITVRRPAKIEEGQEGDICFLANPKYIDYAYTTKASILLVANDFVAAKPITPTLIRVENVYNAITLLLEQFEKQQKQSSGSNQIDPLAFVDASAVLGSNVKIGAFAYIGKNAKIGNDTIVYPQVFVDENVEIGEQSTIYAGVKLFRDCRVGHRVIIHGNAVIGSDGFGFAPQEDGTFKKVPQLGNVVVGNDVEIGANTVIDRATMGSTEISDGVKLDNLIQIAHNVFIGKNTGIAAQAGIAGSTRIGENCLIGGQTGFVGHIKIANKVKVQAQSGINKSIEQEGAAVYGSPAMPYNDFLRSYSLFSKLPELEKRLRELEKLQQGK